MPADNIGENFRPSVTEMSKPVEKLPATKTNINQILTQSDNEPLQKTFQKLSSLEILPKTPDSLSVVVQPEMSINNSTQDKVRELRKKIRNLLLPEKDTSESIISDIQTSSTEVKPKIVRVGFIEGIKNKYAEKQQQKIDKYKQLFSNDFGSVPSEEGLSKIESLPLYKQFGRIALEIPIVKTILSRLYQNSHRQQEKEAENIAATEYYQKINLKIKTEHQAEMAQKTAKEEEEKRAKVNRKIKEARISRQKFKKKFLDGMDNYRQGKIESRKKERAQELLERMFNQRLTKLEDIDINSQIDGTGVEKTQREDIIFYDMKGYQFRFLQHAINYKYSETNPGQKLIGSQTAKELIYNPSLWEKSQSDIGKTGGHETDSKSNIIATTYINTETNLTSWGQHLIYYGFDDVLPGSLIESIGGVGGTSTHIEEGSIKLTTDPNFLGTPEHIEESGNFYNEVDLKRYDSSGKPKLPKFLIVKDWNYQTQETREIFLRHARHFNIPIINIETRFYKSKKKLT